MRLHPGYEFKLWTDASAREMVAEDYPEYLQMYDGYGYGIQVGLCTASSSTHRLSRPRGEVCAGVKANLSVKAQLPLFCHLAQQPTRELAASNSSSTSNVPAATFSRVH